jgi:hypothetical protein
LTNTVFLDQIGASIEGFIWPKIFWDFLTHSLDVMVKPFPILHINLIFGITMIALEWPLPLLAGTSVHRSIEFRLAILPLSALACLLMYQSTNPGLYYLVGMGAYFWAFSEGEVCFRIIFFSSIILSLMLTSFCPDHLRETLDLTSANTKRSQQSLRLKCQGIIQARKKEKERKERAMEHSHVSGQENPAERREATEGQEAYPGPHGVVLCCIYKYSKAASQTPAKRTSNPPDEKSREERKKSSQSQTKSNSSTKRASQDSASFLFIIFRP